ncbi:MAG: twin-arginine translocase subunit TatC [Planctomycetaceae bacterium]|nr:twin-arginine translocase subunit TatC [Planctomycetaceae bacterium]MBP63347.1 twin-arginine translocase subunit TatC [Planctomycetaceae bacterium]
MSSDFYQPQYRVMPDEYNDDLFAKSTMTFGEHLEELRHALVWSLGGLMIAFLFGLAFSNLVVEAIKNPLEIALEKYYLENTINELTDQYEDLDSDVQEFVKEKRFAFQKVYLEVAELQRVLQLIPDGEKVPSSQPGQEPDNTDVSNEMEDEALTVPSSEMILTRVWSRLDPNISTLSVQESFVIWLKAGLVAGIVISSPWIFYHIWAFVAAGLYAHERRYIYVFLPFSIGLFLAGVGLAYFFVFDYVLDFLLSFNRKMNIDAEPRISEWMSFVLFLPLGFGISFQLPLVMLFLERIGVFDVASYLRKWRVAILVIFTLAMFLTPADPMSMLLMASPLTILYFGGVALCQWMPRLHRPLEEPELE